MEKQKNRTDIEIRVQNCDDDGHCRVKKIYWKDGRMIKKFALDTDGHWVHIPEGHEYPIECCHPIV